MNGVVNNTFWLLLSWGTRVVLGLLVGVAVARHLGPTQYGEFAYLLSILSIFQAATTLGMDSLVIRDLASQPDRVPGILGSVLRIRILTGFVGWLGCVMLAAILQDNTLNAVPLMIILGGALVFQSAEAIDLWFQSQLQSRRTVLSRVATLLISNAVRIALLLIDAPLSAFIAVCVLESALLAASLYIAYRHYPVPGRLLWQASVVPRLLRQSWPLMLSSLAVVIYMRMDQVMLKSLATADQLGYFSAAITLAQAWLFLPSIIFSSLVPGLSRLHAQTPELFFKRLQLIYTGAVLLSLPIIAVVFSFAPEIVKLIYGVAYAEAANPLIVYVLCTTWMALGLVQAMWIFRPNRNWVTLVQTAVGAFVSIAANLLLIPRYGALGAAFSALMAQIASTCLVNAVLDRQVFRMQIRALCLFDLPDLLRAVGSLRHA